MPFIKGNDNIARTVLNPLASSVADAHLDDIIANGVTVNGNIDSGNIQADGYFLTSGNSIVYTNSNVAAYLPTYTGDVSANNVTVTNNFGVLSGNIVGGAALSVTGNITGGNVSVTNITGTLETASQPAIEQVGTLSSLSVNGNIDTANINSGIISSTGTVVSSGPLIVNSYANVGALLTAYSLAVLNDTEVSGNITVTGNITAGITGPYVDDIAAGNAGVSLNQLYYDSGGSVKIRLT